jgi:hypothetical protein
MKPNLIATAALLTFHVLPLSADTFILKDGTTLEGRILNEDSENYVIEVQVTKTIKDERTIAKADVTKVEREKPDLKAFESIATLVPVPDMMTADQYASRIQVVEKFLNDHRGSEKTKDARDMLATLKREANEILAGGVKVGGQVISPNEYRANALEIDARGQEKKIRDLISGGHFLDALRAFATFDIEFKGTQPHTALLPLIIQAIGRYTADVQQQLASYDKLVKDREAGLSRLQVVDRRNAEAAIKEELEAAERQLKKERDERLGWYTIQPYFKPSMQETLNFAKLELTRLNAAMGKQTGDSGKAYREALLKLSTADAKARTTILSEARSAGVPAKYLAKLEAASTR